MKTFESLGLGEPIMKGIQELGFVTPTPIQESVIPSLLQGSTDMVALAQTGTGKTAAFGLPLLSLIDTKSGDTQALILCPTRELCMQITKDLQNYARFMKGVNVVAVYGGTSIQNQISDIQRGAQIIVATPGRMLDIIGRKRVQLSTVKFVVLDEADEMLNMGFKEDLDEILSKTPETKNTWLFSATMPDEVLRISKNYMTNPVEFTMGNKNQGNENIEHVYYVVNSRDKYHALKRIADINPDIFAIVFCRTKRETQQVADLLIKDGYNADALHGDLSQSQRDHVMKRYRGRTLQMLVATDVAARGIDVNDVTHVINYNLPDELENYTHRSGRTARAGKTGVSILISSPSEGSKIHTIERMIKKKFTKASIPNGVEVCEKQLFSLVSKIHDVEVNEEGISQYLPKIMEELKELSKEEIIKRFVSTEFNRFLAYYKNVPDLNVGASQGRTRDGSGERPGVIKLFISIGELDKLDKVTLVDYVCQTAAIPKSAVTWVNVKNSFSFIEVSAESLPAVMEAFKNESFQGRKVRIESRGNEAMGVPRDRNRYNGGRRSEGSSDSSWKKDRPAYGDRKQSRSRESSGDRERRPASRESYGDRERQPSRSREFSGAQERTSSRPRESYGDREKSAGTNTGFKPRERSESDGAKKYEKRPRFFKKRD